MKIRARPVGRSSMGNDAFDGELTAVPAPDIVTGSMSGIADTALERVGASKHFLVAGCKRGYGNQFRQGCDEFKISCERVFFGSYLRIYRVEKLQLLGEYSLS